MSDRIGEITVSFSIWLKERRNALGLSQKEVALCARCSTVAIRKIEAGERRPSRQVVEVLAHCLDIPPEERTGFLKFARAEPSTALNVAKHQSVDSRWPWRTLYANLPAQPTLFIGREKEIAAASELLTRPGSRLLTLSGTPGVGKTRLAVEVASRVLDSFPDGVFFVALASVRDPGLVASTIAETLKLKTSGSQRIEDLLKLYLNDKRLLLVLDNFEHLLDASLLVADLLAAAPQLRLLITSRAVLHIRGETDFDVPPLALPSLPADNEALGTEKLLGFEAIRLFVDRARDARYEFTLTANNAPQIVNICHRLDGLPLAIELAAAQLRNMSPVELLERLENKLSALIGGPRDLPPRQQTLHSAIEWSYNLLGAREQKLFYRLGVFMGGCTLGAVEAVCIEENSTDLLDVLTRLVTKSLLRQDGGVSEGGGELRFWMLETIREYAQQRLDESEESDELRRKHALYFLALAEEADPQLDGPRQSEWLDRLEVEHDNFRAALRWATEIKDSHTALRLAGDLARFWLMHSHINEGREQLDRVLAIPTSSPSHTSLLSLSASPGESEREHQLPGHESPRGDPIPRYLDTARVKVLFRAGTLAEAWGDSAVAQPLLEESLAVYRKLGEKRTIGTVLNNLAIMMFNLDKLSEARTFYEEGLQTYRELDDRKGVAQILGNLGQLTTRQGDYAQARIYLEESLATYKAFQHQHGTAHAYSGLAEVEHNQGNYMRATQLHEEGLALYRQIGDKWGEAWALDGVAAALRRQGKYAEARAMYEQSLHMQRELGEDASVSVSLSGLALVALGEGDLRTARSLLLESLAICAELDNKHKIAECLENIAIIAEVQGAAQEAVRLWGKAEALREAVGIPIPAIDLSDYKSYVANAYTTMSDEAFREAWKEGGAISVEQAVTLATPLVAGGRNSQISGHDRQNLP